MTSQLLPSIAKKLKSYTILCFIDKIFDTHGGTRTPNLRFRRPTPYPLGHAGTVKDVFSLWGIKKKKMLRRPGIEPGSQEWESCMIPLHQRRMPLNSQQPG